MIEENLKNIDGNVSAIKESVAKLTEIAQAFLKPQDAIPAETSGDPVVSSVEIDGEKFVRVHAGKYDFRIALHDAPDTMNWDDAKKYCEDKGMRLFTLEEGLLMFCFKDEINAKLVELGGEALREDEGYWSGTENPRYTARYVYFYNGYAGNYYKCSGLVVRPVAASKPCA